MRGGTVVRMGRQRVFVRPVARDAAVAGSVLYTREYFTEQIAANPKVHAPCGGVWYREAEGAWRDDSVFLVERILDKRLGAAGHRHGAHA